MPPGEKALSSSSNKKQQISLVFESVDAIFRNSLLIAGPADIQIEVHDGKMIQHFDLTTTHEEADFMLLMECYKLVQSEILSLVKFISDDADVICVRFSLQLRPKGKNGCDSADGSH